MGIASNAGLLPLPVPAVCNPGTSVSRNELAPSDPALDQLVLYFGALWKAYAGEAWCAANPGVDNSITRNLFKHNPREEDFVDQAVPALYMWREPEERAIARGDEFEVSVAHFELLWIMPPAPTVRKADRSPFFNAWSKAIQKAAKGEPDRNWIACGETDKSALFWGSPILEYAGLVEMRFVEATANEVRVPIKGGGDRVYPAFGARIMVQEQTELKVDGYPLGGLDLKIYTPDGLRLVDWAIVHAVPVVARIRTVSTVTGKATVT